MLPPTGIVLNGAVSQYDRWLRALDPGYAAVDGRTFPQLLDFAVQYGALIRFYNLADEPDGDWVEFFLDDPSMMLTAIASVDAAELEAKYLSLQRATRAERDYPKKFELLRATFAFILELARRMYGWRQVSSSFLEPLREPLRRLQSYDEGAGLPEALGERIGLDYSGLDLGCVCPDGAPYRGATKPRRINHALPYLDPIFYAVLDVLEELQAYARTQFPSTLDTGRHKPQVALYMVFARLFATAQETLNTFSSRYAELYYERVLRERPAAALADSVFLTFTLEPEEGVQRTTVGAATLFLAGQDPVGNEVLYGADRGLTVTAAAITGIATLRVARDESGVPCRVLAAVVDPGAPWPTFGTEKDPEASFGFEVASLYLLLTGGDRRVDLTVVYTDPGLKERLAALAVQTGLKPAEIFETVLRAAFTLLASTAEAWFAVGPYEVFLEDEERFVIRFDLPPAAPPLVPFAPAPLPALQAWLRQEAVELAGCDGTVSIFPLTLLATMDVRRFELDTVVSGLADLTLENTDGPVDSTAPFPVFGGVPVVGSWLQLRSVELFSKTPRCLQVNVQWFNLPQNEDGFEGWYRDYTIGLSGKPEERERVLFDNRTFHGQLDVVQPGSWVVIECSPPDGVFLFRTDKNCLDPVPECDGKLCPDTLFDRLQIEGLEKPSFYDPAGSALRLTLTEPAYSFGSAIYAPNVLAAVLADLPDPAACRQKCLAECAPLERAARAIDKCIEDCWETNPLDDCLATCLVGVVAVLLAEAEACMQRCRAAASPPDDVCQANCLLMLDLAGRLGECLNASPPVDLETCARECRDRLDAAYTASLAACESACTSPKKDLHYPNDPYLPMAQSVRADYTAHSSDVSLQHLLPLGGAARVTLPAPLLPRFPWEGTFTLDFTALTAGTLTLLFRMASEEHPLADPPEVTWEVSDGTKWQPLDDTARLSDTTDGLRSTGILTLEIPGGARALRAAVGRDASTFPRTAAVTPHVVTATWQAGTSTGETLGTPLPAGTITSAVQELPFIATIEQPIESFGGRPPEDRRAFQIRLGERLRHKQRAILAWDYERLVLERFPTIWKAAALPPSVPGEVVVVTVQGPGSIEVVDPTIPLAPGHLLTQIRCYLEDLASPFVKLRVVNPDYVRIEVTAKVEFSTTAGSGDHLARLNDDLVRYLSPWFYDEERAATKGRYASEDEISEFVQTRDYVEAMQSISFRYVPDPEEKDWYFLTSAASHVITEVAPDESDPCGRARG